MQLSDLFIKIANNARLTPQELAFLKQMGDTMQLNNTYVTSLQNNAYIKSILINSSSEFIQSELGAKVKVTTNQSVNTGGGGTIDSVFTNAVYDDSNFWNSGSPTRLTIPITGRYVVAARAYWEPSANAGTRQALIYKNGSSGIGVWNTQQNDSGASRAVLCFAYGEVTFTKNDYITLALSQFTGSALNCTDSYITIRLIRPSDSETSTGA